MPPFPSWLWTWYLLLLRRPTWKGYFRSEVTFQQERVTVQQSLERRVFLKLNKRELTDMQMYAEYADIDLRLD